MACPACRRYARRLGMSKLAAATRTASALCWTLVALGCSAPEAPRGAVPAPPSASIRIHATPASTTIAVRKPAPPGKYVVEQDDTAHRTGAERCDVAIVGLSTCRGDEDVPGCRLDADCRERPHGRCMRTGSPAGSTCGCQYPCETDADCSAGEACLCHGALGIDSYRGALPGGGVVHSSLCVPAQCLSDTDCESGVCGVSAWFDGCVAKIRLACRTKRDTCRLNSDCGSHICASDGDRWVCRELACVR
jgi:hypothetical protein